MEKKLLGDWGLYDNQLPKAALLHLVNACGQDSPDPRGAARDLCAAVRKDLDRRSSGALVDPNDCSRICKAAVSVHRAVLHRGNVAARRQLVVGHPDLFRLPQAAQPKSVACGAGWRAELAVAYCAYLHRYTRLLREHADLDNLQGVELYGEASAEYDAAAAAWGEVAVAARGTNSKGGDGRDAYLAQALRKLKAVQVSAGSPGHTATSGAPPPPPPPPPDSRSGTGTDRGPPAEPPRRAGVRGAAGGEQAEAGVLAADELVVLHAPRRPRRAARGAPGRRHAAAARPGPRRPHRGRLRRRRRRRHPPGVAAVRVRGA